MKALFLSFLAPLLLTSGLRAQAAPPGEEVSRFGVFYPKATLREILEIAGPLAGKKIRVADEEDLKIEMALNLPGPVAKSAVLKAISALVILEGFELADAGKEMELRRLLEPQQVKALREGLKLPATAKQQGPVPRPRAVNGEPPESWIVIAPAPGK